MAEKELDYEKLGLKSGIEIHQQLEGKKLFCDCPCTLRDDKPDFEVTRELRAVIGETGEIDIAARHEMEKGRYYTYQGYSDTTCLVELDEEPPHLMNQKALDTALQVCALLEAKPVDEVQIMRKTVVNGSNTTGFQRTSLIARNGIVKTKEGEVRIATVCLEEDAAKDIEKAKDHVVYRLDRLGIPLIEIATEPDIKTPEQCKETAEFIGMVLRSTGNVKRGLGTIRQDVNVSIKGGQRIEVKGAQDLKMIPTLVRYEVLRQIALIETAAQLKDKKISFGKTEDITKIFKNTRCQFVKKAIDTGKTVFGVKVAGFKGVFGKETAPGKRIGSEISDHAKIRAGVGGIIHSDEKLEKYQFSDNEIAEVRKRLGAKADDLFFMIVDERTKAENAVKYAMKRVEKLNQGVLKEVRKANADGTTSYMRPMPGAARMYPETDTLPIRPDLSKIKKPELLVEKKARFKEKHDIAEDLAHKLSKSGKTDLFEDFAERFSNIKPAFIAEMMLAVPANLRRKYGVDETRIKDSDLEKIFDLLNSNKITKDSVEDIMLKIAKNEKVDYKEYAQLSDKELEKEIKRLLKESEGLEFKIVIGKVMGTLKGKAEGKKILDMLKRLNNNK